MPIRRAIAVTRSDADDEREISLQQYRYLIGLPDKIRHHANFEVPVILKVTCKAVIRIAIRLRFDYDEK